MLAACLVAGGALLASASPAAAAEGAYVVADVQCDPSYQGVLDLTLVNDRSSAAATIEVLDGRVVTVGPLSAYAITLTDLDDGAFPVPVTIDGTDASIVVDVRCDGPQVAVLPSSVRSEQVAGRLPATGDSIGWGFLIGAAMVVAGVAASVVARRQHPHP